MDILSGGFIPPVIEPPFQSVLTLSRVTSGRSGEDTKPAECSPSTMCYT